MVRIYRSSVTTCTLIHMNSDLTDWLLESDPAVRWQVERDLLGASEAIWNSTRRRVSTEGFGAALLAHQESDGQWDGGSYFPRNFDFSTAKTQGQPWTATTWSLNSLREWGVEAGALGETASLLAMNSKWDYEGLPYWAGEVDCCINAYTFANGAWLGAPVDALANWFVEHQMTEGGWNCDWVEGSTRSSFHSTLNSLKGILEYEIIMGSTPELTAARKAGEEYLLERNLLYRASTGELISPWATDFSYPTRWKYNVLRAVDYFRMAAIYEKVKPDPRLTIAISIIRDQAREDGRYLQGSTYPGKVWFEVDVPEGQASKWITLFAQRILLWWE